MQDLVDSGYWEIVSNHDKIVEQMLKVNPGEYSKLRVQVKYVGGITETVSMNDFYHRILTGDRRDIVRNHIQNYILDLKKQFLLE